MTINKNHPAFPCSGISNSGGLSIREYYAGLAMQGLLACGRFDEKKIGIDAVAYADKLIAALEEN